ncbi:MAG: RNA polymerase sigma factor SigJ [Micromonosporaceae bacterium]|nr:RNA polymerase sigma factor SigJ [Micromonosporaceae bacterium]
MPDLRDAETGVDFRPPAREADADVDFEAHRSHLMAVAYRMLGSRGEAEDAVQETWLRYAAARQADGSEPIRDLRAWLTTTTARICLDMLRSARVRREAYVGPWLPEPVVTRLPGQPVATGVPLSGWLAGEDTGFAPDPAERAARTDEIGIALLVVLERLTPEQRVAFVLHDVFALPFEEVATVLGTSPAAARQLASRARRAVTAPGAPRSTADPAEQRRVLSAFLSAAESGDLAGLLAVLAPDVVAMGDSNGKVKGAGRRPVVTAEKVARFLIGLFRRAAAEPADIVVEPVLVNGDLGLLFEVNYHHGETVRFVTAVAVADGRITGLFNQLNPDKLAAVPPPDPARSWRFPQVTAR